MITFRPFLNNDIPQIVSLWRSQPPFRGLFHDVGAMLLEQHVFGKLYFDPQGLILAFDEQGLCLGFVHAAFGADVTQGRLDFQTGVISLVMARSGGNEELVAGELIGRGVQYVRHRGARTVWAGSVPPFAPFYEGLYGGCTPVGILQSDARRLGWFQAAGFRPAGSCSIYQLRSGGLRPVVTREQLLCRRQYRVETLLDPAPRNWWEANRAARHDMWLFRLLPLNGGAPVAEILYGDVEPLAMQWGMHAAEVISLKVLVEPANPELSLSLLVESIKQLMQTGTQLIQFAVETGSLLSTRLDQLGFQLIDQGVFLKQDGQEAT